VSNFFAKVSSPVLSDIEIDYGPLLVDYTYPRKMPDLFRGMQMTIIGRYKNTNDLNNIVLRMTGKTAKAAKSFTYTDLDFPVRNESNDFLPRLWASRRVGWLVEQLRGSPDSKELRDELIDLGTRYGLVTPFTSYLATDGTLSNFAQDASMEQRMALPAARAVREKSGKGAVQASVQQNSAQTNTQVAAMDDGRSENEQVVIRNSRYNQFVANRNFINQSGVWVDSEYNPDSEKSVTELKFGSDEYFSLINRERGIAQYLALGEQVVVVWKGTTYRVTK